MKTFLLFIAVNLFSHIIKAEFSEKLSHIIKDIENFNYLCKHKLNYTLSECFMIKTLKILEKKLDSPIIELSKNARLVKALSTNKDSVEGISKNKNKKRKVVFNYSGYQRIIKRYPRTWKNWATVILTRFSDIFRTHVLHLNILQGQNKEGNARHRRRHQMLPMMLLGVVSVATIIIPMGFQFLAVIAGKSFLMAKMALIMASVNGLKRVASSGVHYGLYHTDGYHYPHASHPGSHFSQYWHDRDGIGRTE